MNDPARLDTQGAEEGPDLYDCAGFDRDEDRPFPLGRVLVAMLVGAVLWGIGIFTLGFWMSWWG